MTKTYNDIDAVTRLLEEVSFKKKNCVFIMMLKSGLIKIFLFKEIIFLFNKDALNWLKVTLKEGCSDRLVTDHYRPIIALRCLIGGNRSQADDTSAMRGLSRRISLSGAGKINIILYNSYFYIK